MAGRYKDSSEFMNWYRNLDENAKKKHNRLRYLKACARREAKGEVIKHRSAKDETDAQYTNSFMKWYLNLDEEQKKEYNRKRYLRSKALRALKREKLYTELSD